MKKTYLQPATETINVETTEMLAESIGILSDELDPVKAESRDEVEDFFTYVLSE